jgi:hypothetical protein
MLLCQNPLEICVLQGCYVNPGQIDRSYLGLNWYGLARQLGVVKLDSSWLKLTVIVIVSMNLSLRYYENHCRHNQRSRYMWNFGASVPRVPLEIGNLQGYYQGPPRVSVDTLRPTTIGLSPWWGTLGLFRSSSNKKEMLQWSIDRSVDERRQKKQRNASKSIKTNTCCNWIDSNDWLIRALRYKGVLKYLDRAYAYRVPLTIFYSFSPEKGELSISQYTHNYK